ncbi:sugar-binding protein, partial [Bacillus cereus]
MYKSLTESSIGHIAKGAKASNGVSIIANVVKLA